MSLRRVSGLFATSLVLWSTAAHAAPHALVESFSGLERHDLATGERRIVLDLPSASNIDLNVASTAHDPATGDAWAILAPTIYELNVATTGERIVHIPASGDEPRTLLDLNGTDRPQSLLFDPRGALRFTMRKAGGVLERRSLDLATGVVTVLTDTRSPTHITTSTLYFIEGTSLIAESRADGTQRTIATLNGLLDAAIDEDNGVVMLVTSRQLTTSTRENALHQVPLTGGTPTQLHAFSGAGSIQRFVGLTLDPIQRRGYAWTPVGLGFAFLSMPYGGGALQTITPRTSFPIGATFMVSAQRAPLVAPIAAAPSGTNVAWHYTMGSRFVAERAGSVTQLGGRFTGTKTVRLYRELDRSVLAEVQVTGAGTTFTYASIPAVRLNRGEAYVVAVVLAGSGASYGTLAAGANTTQRGLRYTSSVYAYTASNPNAYPATASSTLYGVADVQFSPEGYVPATGPQPREVFGATASVVNGPSAWHYAMGYAFTPTVSGTITGLGGRFDGAKRVRLYDDATRTVLAEAMVNGSAGFAYAPVSVPLTAGQRYLVAVSLAGSGGYAEPLTVPLPRAHGSIVIEASRYASTSTNPDAYPTTTSTTTMFGIADVRFVPDEPTSMDEPQWRMGTNLQMARVGVAFAGGLRFRPVEDCWLTALGGRYFGSVPVELWDVASNTMVASATVVGAGSYAYVDVTPVRLTAGRSYLVVARVEANESVSEILFDGLVRLPRTQGLVTFDASLTSSSINGMPSLNQANDAFGVPDFKLAR